MEDRKEEGNPKAAITLFYSFYLNYWNRRIWQVFPKANSLRPDWVELIGSPGDLIGDGLVE